MALPGWGTLAGKIAEWLPGRTESIRTQIRNLEREEDEILRQPYSDSRSRKLADISVRLRNHRQKIADAA